MLAIASAIDAVFCSVGTHPHNAAEELDVTTDDLVALARHPKVVAIGEAGLDYHYDKAPRAAQAEGASAPTSPPRATGLPLVIHARDADDDMAAILTEENGKGAFPVILHCFSSGRDLAMTGVALGGYVSFSGILTFKNSQANSATSPASLPRDRLLVETDAPYLAPTPHRGKRNEPAYVVETAAVLAETIGVSAEEIAADHHRQFLPAVHEDAAAPADARLIDAARLRLTILGCGSSPGMPRITGDWGACDPANPKNRRTRCFGRDGRAHRRRSDADPRRHRHRPGLSRADAGGQG